MYAIQLLALHDDLCKSAKDLMTRKNYDYTSGSGDPFANFRGSSYLGIDPVLGVMLRMQDKMMRVKTFAEKGELKVKDEGVKDALVDLINYTVLMCGLIEEGKKNQTTDEKKYVPTIHGYIVDEWKYKPPENGSSFTPLDFRTGGTG